MRGFVRVEKHGINAVAFIRTVNPCGSGSAGLAQVGFPIPKGETQLDLRILMERCVVEVFVMGGRVVFSKTYSPQVLYVPDTNVVVQAWVATLTSAVDVFAMGRGWTNSPYQSEPTEESVSSF